MIRRSQAPVVHPFRNGNVPGTQRQPRLSEPQPLVEIGERVQLDRCALPGMLDLPPQLGWEPGWLGGIRAMM